MIQRFKFSEFDKTRLIQGIMRRILDIPDIFSWSLSKEAIENRNRLEILKNQHKGERCFILGNGPSLGKMDLSKLKGEISIGTNRIYLLFEKTDFRPTYYISVNELVLKQFYKEISWLSMPQFINWNMRHLYGFRENIYYLRLGFGLRDRFTGNPLRPLSGGGTVTFVAMQMAFFMGFSEVILIGVDHNFVDKGVPNRSEIRSSEVDLNHFHPNYFPKGSKWQLPDLTRSEIAYGLARQAFEKEGRKVLDATIGGNLTVFEKVDWSSLIK